MSKEHVQVDNDLWLMGLVGFYRNPIDVSRDT
jgi:hypothetical protein